MIHDEIEKIRRQLGSKLLILGHHYQNEEVIRHTDLRGDSFQLSTAAAERSDCEMIVFCGVHFMAETADILANTPERLVLRNGRRVDVFMPDPSAGCDMADLASIKQVEECWNELAKYVDVSDIVPITYVNSTADLKAFCGRNGGISCTSSNAEEVLRWALRRKSRVLFFPDQHLGRNIATKMGIDEKLMPLWKPGVPDGGLSRQEIADGKIILWDGYCYVHQKFTPEQIDAIRKEYPGIQVIVHLECSKDVVDKADYAGSTKLILDLISKSPAGSQWAVGTEWNMVNRLMSMFPDKTIRNLSPAPSCCETMNRISLENLCECLKAVSQHKNAQRYLIHVPEEIAPDAAVCLQRMLECKSEPRP